MPTPTGTTQEVGVERVVDGDTIKVRFPEAGDAESDVVDLRILALDTEESRGGSGKPKTPWGVAAKEHATEFVPSGSTVTLEFPGTESLAECLRRYRDNYGRLLVYVYVDGEDFQEHMIREGYSPYFTKYGYAAVQVNHERYREAEREAQANDRGVWNQFAVNGAEMRDYHGLSAWWALRAEAVERYRAAATEGDVFDSRLDYDALRERAGSEATVFTEIAEVERVGAAHAVASNGSREQRFKLFLPDALETESGQRVLSLLRQRYVAESDGTTVQRPTRSYAFVTGPVKRYPPRDGEPEIDVTSIEQVTDVAPHVAE
ncbi:nuclease [Salinigranum rubrum]|uniref:Nuclease n=1 Tax=Salinigranum rubrum TaxID=755307 RepID=A0A2I8VG27_9EURY|nr:thermonuclease family protein [Salinigranum rubrum]AUV80871.1 nuclease [Salinigranum rubrum]